MGSLIVTGFQLIPVRFRLHLLNQGRFRLKSFLSPLRENYRKLNKVREHAELPPKVWILFIREVLKQSPAHTGRGHANIEAFRCVLHADREP